jgi:hypothetical protein
VIRCDEAGAVGDGNEGANVVEEVDEEKDEYYFEGATAQSGGDVEVKGCGLDCGEVVGNGLPVDLMAEDAEQGGGEDSDEHGGSDAKDLEDCDEKETEDREYGRRGVKVAEGDRGGRAGDDDAGVAESDKGDEETDASTDCSVELVGDRGDEALADARKSQCEKDDTGEEDGSEGGLPGNTHAFNNSVGEVGVEAHARGEGERVVGKSSHENAAEGGAEAGGSGDCGEGHAGFGEDGWVDEDDVSHRDEGGEAGENLSAPIGGMGGEAEVMLKACADGGQVRLLFG